MFSGPPNQIYVPRSPRERLSVDVSGCHYAHAPLRIHRVQGAGQLRTAEVSNATNAVTLTTALRAASLTSTPFYVPWRRDSLSGLRESSPR